MKKKEKLKGTLAFVFIAILFLSIFSAFAPKVNAQQSTVDWWTMFHHDVTLSGYSTSPSPLTNQTLWAFTTGDAISSSPAIDNNVVYVGSWDGNVYALNAQTGNKIWSYNTHGQAVESSPAVANGVVYIGADDNNFYALDAATGSYIWSYNTTNFVASSPVVTNNVVYVSLDNGNLYALNAAKGTRLWNYTIGDSTNCPAVVNGVVYVTGNGNVYALNAAKGTKIWSYSIGDFAFSSPAVAKSIVYVNSEDGNVYALNAATGTKIWNYTTSGGTSTPAVADGVVYVGSIDGNFYALNYTTGKYIWSYEMPGKNAAIESSPAVANGVVYIGAWTDSVPDDNIYAFGSIAVPQPSPTIPEFPTWIILPLFTVMILISIAFVRKRTPKKLVHIFLKGG
jgi:serine/threonine-protein kinase